MAVVKRITGLAARTTYTVRGTARHRIDGQTADGDSAEGSGTNSAAPVEDPPPKTLASDARVHASPGADERGTLAGRHAHDTLVITVAVIPASILEYDRDDWKHWTDGDHLIVKANQRKGDKN